MPTVTRFEDLDVWKSARILTNTIYDLSDQGEFARDFGLKDQIRRAAVSVMSNIAEGFESQTQAVFIRYLGHAKGSAGEVRAQLYIALDRGYLSEIQFTEAYDLVDKVSRQLYRLMAYLNSQPNARRFREEQIEYNISV